MEIRFSSTIIALVLISTILTFSLNAMEITVESGDTVYGLARKYSVSEKAIIMANHLTNAQIQRGQKLTIPQEGNFTITVQAGDTLSGLALAFDVSQKEIRWVNSLQENDGLWVGQKLTIPSPTPQGTYRVLPGDSLLAIAGRYGISSQQLRSYNGLQDDLIHPGDILQLQGSRPDGHVVQPGESLWSIAQKHNLQMEDLQNWNHLQEDLLLPGRVLTLYPGIENPEIPSAPALQEQAPMLAVSVPPQPKPAILSSTPSLPRFGEYFFEAPEAPKQPNVRYWEGSDGSISTDRSRAQQILALFDAEIEQEGLIDSSMKGWFVVIDPGHGGLDPGAIVSATDGNGNPVVVTEDEYAYDIALRLKRQLERHGATTALTTLAPDHHLRNGEPQATFVHRKNEVYNDDGPLWRPVGTTDGLERRKTIAKEQIRKAPRWAKRKGTLFISVHCDNTSEFPQERLVLFDGSTTREKSRSQELAQALIPYLGEGSLTRTQELRVLRDNPADRAVLVEMRNIFYPQNAWALRSAELREQDARMLANGIRAWTQP